MKRSTYYYHIKHKSYPDKYKNLKIAIQEIYAKNKGRYGCRRIHAVLKQKGYTINHKTTQKLMKELRLQGKQIKNRYRSYQGTVGKLAPNVLKRNFKAKAPFEKLVTDVTEFRVFDTKIYLSPILDLFNSEIVSYSLSKRPNFAQTENMLKGLFSILPKGVKPIMHSDQGWQYQMKEYRQALLEHNITQSMSRKGNCLDNSVMENFFGRLKVEMFYGETFEDCADFERKLAEYIRYFNEERISLKRKGMSPIDYKKHYILQGKSNAT